ncbi:MAG: hypothetical protein ACRDRO_13830 [Pseudonocardiaceae bacterium]
MKVSWAYTAERSSIARRPDTPRRQLTPEPAVDVLGSEKLWAGIATIHPGPKTGAHHHGEVESVIYVICGRARMRWGANTVRPKSRSSRGDYL